LRIGPSGVNDGHGHEFSAVPREELWDGPNTATIVRGSLPPPSALDRAPSLLLSRRLARLGLGPLAPPVNSEPDPNVPGAIRLVAGKARGEETTADAEGDAIPLALFSYGVFARRTAVAMAALATGLVFTGVPILCVLNDFCFREDASVASTFASRASFPSSLVVAIVVAPAIVLGARLHRPWLAGTAACIALVSGVLLMIGASWALNDIRSRNAVK